MGSFLETYNVPPPIHQMLLQSYEEDIEQISQGSTKQNNSLGEFSKT